MTYSPDPAALSAADRERELARILAAGLLRLRWPADHAAPAAIPGKSRESEANPLALLAERSVTVHGG